VLPAEHFGGKAAREIEASSARSQGEFAEGFEVSKVEREGVRLAEASQDSPLQGDGLRLQRGDRDSAVRPSCWNGGEKGGSELFEKCVFGRGDFGGLTEGFAKSGVVVTLEGGKQFAADAIAQKTRVEIGGVLAERLMERVQVTLDLLA